MDLVRARVDMDERGDSYPNRAVMGHVMSSESVRTPSLTLVTLFAALTILLQYPTTGLTQEQSAATRAAGEDAVTSPAPLNAAELEVLVARIALYPDELIAVISAASLYPLQIVEAARYLDQYKKDNSLKPKDSWDGSVISLLNYPEIVKMMSDDLDWTQALGEALAYQQKDVLIAIQQLRDEAVAQGVIKTDDKIQVVEENDNIVIKSVDPQVVYVPIYQPQMFYEAGYPWMPIRYYPDPYPNYWYPGAPFFAGFVTGVVWAAIVDWNDWGIWGGRWRGNDIDIDCNNCFNNRHFDGKINFNDVDWKNIDRSKINIDRDQLNKFDRSNIKNQIERNPDNSIRDRARDIKKSDKVANRVPGKAAGTRDVRKSMQDGLKAKPANTTMPANKPNIAKPSAKPSLNRPTTKPANVTRPAGKPKPAAKIDSRPKKPSGLGNVNRGKATKVSSNRGHKSMGGGQRGGGHKKVQNRGGGRRR